MAKAPATLDDVLLAFGRLQNVVERTEKRQDDLEQAHALLERLVEQIETTADHVLVRSDELGADVVKVRRAAAVRRQQTSIEADAGSSMTERLAPRVVSVRVGNKTVRRAARPR